jgi:hypothetical protein
MTQVGSQRHKKKNFCVNSHFESEVTVTVQHPTPEKYQISLKENQYFDIFFTSGSLTFVSD